MFVWFFYYQCIYRSYHHAWHTVLSNVLVEGINTYLGMTQTISFTNKLKTFLFQWISSLLECTCTYNISLNTQIPIYTYKYTYTHTNMTHMHTYKWSLNTNHFTLHMKKQFQQRHFSGMQLAFHSSLFCFTSWLSPLFPDNSYVDVSFQNTGYPSWCLNAFPWTSSLLHLSFHSLYSSAAEFLFVSFYDSYPSVKLLILFVYCFPDFI